jgi:putative FmdB family regulatory protein
MAPIYSYTCPNCSHRLDVMKKMEDAASVEYCPEECAPWQPMLRVYTDAPAGKVSGGTPRFHHRAAKRA